MDSTAGAVTLEEVEEKATIDIDNYFEVRGLVWDASEQDYTRESPGEFSAKRFNEYIDAEKFFFSVEPSDFPGGLKNEMKLDLIHYRFGSPHYVRSRVLFPLNS